MKRRPLPMIVGAINADCRTKPRLLDLTQMNCCPAGVMPQVPQDMLPCCCVAPKPLLKLPLLHHAPLSQRSSTHLVCFTNLLESVLSPRVLVYILQDNSSNQHRTALVGTWGIYYTLQHSTSWPLMKTAWNVAFVSISCRVQYGQHIIWCP